jgi:hypothetical protein
VLSSPRTLSLVQLLTFPRQRRQRRAELVEPHVYRGSGKGPEGIARKPESLHGQLSHMTEASRTHHCQQGPTLLETLQTPHKHRAPTKIEAPKTPHRHQALTKTEASKTHHAHQAPTKTEALMCTPESTRVVLHLATSEQRLLTPLKPSLHLVLRCMYPEALCQPGTSVHTVHCELYLT